MMPNQPNLIPPHKLPKIFHKDPSNKFGHIGILLVFEFLLHEYIIEGKLFVMGWGLGVVYPLIGLIW